MMAIFLTLMTTGCTSFYVDTALKDVPPENMKKLDAPKPVQLLFEFQTKDASNPVATQKLRPRVEEIVKKTGVFSELSPGPVSSGAVLSIVVNNVVLTDNAAGKGFVTGLTFGIAGSAVTDGYICTIVYIPDGNAPKISKTVRHAIHTTLGNANPPAGAVKSASAEDAVNTMMRQIIMNAVNDIANDPSFK
jgi:hypothetical protein